MKKLFEVFLSFFGFGYSPVAPGTVGSLAALFLVYIFAVSPHPLISLSLSFFLIFVAALFVINLYFEEFKPTKHDPGWIVIDEVLGILLCFMIIWGMQGVHSHLILVLSIGFATFRFFDIVKVWPASFFDQRQSPNDIIFDDLISAIYAALSTLVIISFID